LLYRAFAKWVKLVFWIVSGEKSLVKLSYADDLLALVVRQFA